MMRKLLWTCCLSLACASDSSNDEAGDTGSSSSGSSTLSATTSTSTTVTTTTVGGSTEDSGDDESSSSGTPACDDATGGPDGYATLVEPIVAANCSCHRAGSPAGLSLRCGEGYGELVDVESSEAAPLVRVLPGDVTQSYMWLKLTNQHVGAGGSGGQMPLNRPMLSSEDLATIQGWIEAGAPP